MTNLTTAHTTQIDAPIEDVWKALTTPEIRKQWFFGVDTETDWKVGSPLTHRGEYKGKPYQDKGEVLRFEPPKVLEHSHWSDMSGKRDRPENYQIVTWELAERNGATELSLRERNLPSEEAKATSEQAWEAALGSLKKVVEQ